MYFLPGSDIISFLYGGSSCCCAGEDNQYGDRLPRKQTDTKRNREQENSAYFVHNRMFRNESFMNNESDDNVDALDDGDADNPDDDPQRNIYTQYDFYDHDCGKDDVCNRIEPCAEICFFSEMSCGDSVKNVADAAENIKQIKPA